MKSASANDIRKVHQFIDPDLRRVQLTWDDVEVPARLRDIAEESWQALNKLADEGGDRPDVHATLDEMRAAYADVLRGGRGDRVVDGAGRAPRGVRRRRRRSSAAGRGGRAAPTGSRTACARWCPPPPAAGIRRALGRER